MTLPEFVRLLFDRPVPHLDDTEPLGKTVDDPAEASDPTRLVGLVSALFRGFAELAAPYPFAQVDQGMWLLWHPIWLDDLLRSEQVSLDAAQDCVASAVDLYCGYVAGRGLPEYDTAFFMLWDGIVRQPRANLVDSMVTALRSILKIDDDCCRIAALHGLSHLLDPRANDAIDVFLAEARDRVAPEVVSYAKLCRSGRAM